MFRKYCTSCGDTTLHNETKSGAGRCTYCGHPSTSNVSKREHQEAIRRKQVAKKGRLV